MIKRALFFAILLTFFKINALADHPQIEVSNINDKVKLWSVTDEYLPIISLKISFKNTGYAYDKTDKQGISSLVANMLGQGAANLSSLEYKKKLEELASSISFNVNIDNFTISVTSLKENFDETLKLLNLVLTDATFAQDKIDIVKSQLITAQKRQAENPAYLANVKLKNTLFNGHGYAKDKIGDEESINSITRDELIKFVKDNFTQSNIVLSAVGDIADVNLKEKLANILNSLSLKQNQPTAIDNINVSLVKNTHNIEFDVPQSIIMFAMPGILRDDENFYATYLMNYILGGGGFESRLLDNVRKENGLVYSISTYLDINQKSGFIGGYAATSNENVSQAIELIKQEILDIKQNGVADEELENAKNYLINSLPLKLTKNSNLAGYLNSIQLNNLGKDFFINRTNNIEEISKSDIKKQMDKLLDLEKLVFVVVGG